MKEAVQTFHRLAKVARLSSHDVKEVSKLTNLFLVNLPKIEKRDFASVVWAGSKLRERNLLQLSLPFVAQKANAFNAQDLSLVAWALSNVKLDLKSDINAEKTWNALANRAPTALGPNADKSNLQHLSVATYAFAKASVANPILVKSLKILTKGRLRSSKNNFGSQNICNLCWAFAQFSSAENQNGEVVNDLVVKLANLLDNPPQSMQDNRRDREEWLLSVSNACWAMATLIPYVSHSQKVASAHISTKLFQQVSKLPEFVAHEGAMITSTNILWCAAKFHQQELLPTQDPNFKDVLEVLRSCITKRVMKAAQTSEDLTAPCIANLAWSFGTFSWAEPIVLSLALTPSKDGGARIHCLESRHVVSVLWAAARTNMSSSCIPLWKKMNSMLDKTNEQCVSNSVWALLKVAEAGAVSQDNSSSANQLDKKMFDNLWKGLAKRAKQLVDSGNGNHGKMGKDFLISIACSLAMYVDNFEPIIFKDYEHETFIQSNIQKNVTQRISSLSTNRFSNAIQLYHNNKENFSNDTIGVHQMFEDLIRASIALSKPSLCLDLLHDMKKIGVPIFAELYACCIKMLSGKRFFSDALNVYEILKKDDNSEFKVQVSDSNKIVQISDSSIWSCLLFSSVETQNYNQSSFFFEKVKQFGQPSELDFGNMMRALSNFGDWKGCCNLLTSMEQFGVVADKICINTAMDSCLYANKLDEGEKLFKKLLENGHADAIDCNVLIRGYAKNGQVDRCFNLLKEMQSSGILPSSHSIAFFSRCVAAKNSLSEQNEQTTEKVQEDKSSETFADSQTIKKISELSSKKFSQAFGIYQKAVTSFLPSVDKNAKEVSEMYDNLVRASIALNKPDTSRLLLDDMVRLQIPRSNNFYNRIVKLLMSKKHFQECLRVHELMARDDLDITDASIWSCFLFSAVETNCNEKATQFFEAICELRIPTDMDYNNMIRVYSSLGDHKASIKLLDDMKKKKIKIDKVCYNTVLTTCCNSRDLGCAEKIFYQMQKESKSKPGKNFVDVIDYNSLMKGYARLGQVERCFELLNELKNEKITPSDVTFGILMEVCVNQQQFNRAEKVFDMMEQLGIQMNEIIYTSVIDGYAKAGRLDEAMTLYKRMQQSFQNSSDENGTKPDLISYKALIAKRHSHTSRTKAEAIGCQPDLADATCA